MATLKQRLHRKNGSSYDTIHLETNATVVKMSTTDNTTVSNKLTTVDNSINSLNTEMNSVKISVSNGKRAVASAITDKGVSTSATASFATMANNIRSLNTVEPSAVPVYGTDFTYTGNYEICDDGNNNWRIKFLKSGTFIPKSDIMIDVFLVGGGGGGGAGKASSSGPGGGGGYTKTTKSIKIIKNTSYPIVIGAGGDGYPDTNIYQGTNGGSSSGFSQSVNGGNGGFQNRGGDGGSGGGGGFYGSTYGMLANYEYSCVGGSDGSNGVQYTNYSGNDRYKPIQLSAGSGQGSTTREFGESTGDLYSGGGGGMIYGAGTNFQNNRSTSEICAGGEGGGASGYNYTDSVNGFKYAIENKGGGGGGTNNNVARNHPKIDLGSSGIVIIRNHRE